MLYMVGLGLDDGEITLEGEEAVRKADRVYAEFYTNTANIDLEELEERTGSDIEVLERSEVEQEDVVLESARERDTAFLVSGDPLTATTHYDIRHRAGQEGVETRVFHAPSILTSVSETGLNVYKFGRTVTLPEDSAPESVVEYIGRNDSVGLHTLVLLDIDYDAADAAEKLVELEPGLEDREAVVLSRANRDSQDVEVGELGELDHDFGEPPHSIIIIGDTSHKEEEFLEAYR
ncbi:MAG: diphthine synthase [Candidatus Nanohaloarchaea archaeon]